MQANEEIQRLRASHVPSMPIHPPYPPQHLRPPLRPQFLTSVPLPTANNQQNYVRPSMPQGPPAFTFGPFNKTSQQIPIPGHIPTIASSTIHTTIPPNTGTTSGFIPITPTTTEDPLNVRLKSLEEQNQKMFTLLAKLPGAAVPVEVEPKTRFQASPFVDEITLVDVPKKYSIRAFATKYSGITDPVEHVAQYKQLMWTVPIPALYQEVCMCKSSGSTLTGAALQWLINLKQKIIGSFAELVNQFTRQFASICKMEKQTSDLYYVVQKSGETIRDYFNRFNASMIKVKNCDVKTAIEAYKRTSKDLVDSLRKIDANVRWPKNSENPNKDKDQNKWCDFHEDHSHTTDECISLKKEISHLKSKGHLKGIIPDEQGRPTSPAHTKVVNYITGGSEVCGLTYSAAKRHAQEGPDEHPISDEVKSKAEKELDTMIIAFDQDDTQGVHHKHHDALVIQLTLENCLTKRILIDGGSSANVIFVDTLKVMGIERSEIVRRSTTLIGFNGDSMNTLGEIILPVFAKGINKKTKFNVIDCQSAYNAILGRPWIHEMKVVPSTYHQKIKFPSPWGIQEVLNVDPTFKPIKQKHRKFAPERNKVINDEVDNLLKTGKIREVKYPDWLANVVAVQKKNAKWRVCIDFTYLNKACPKDPFPLPHIDAMVDATAGHELLTFMDAYSRYNQILMHTDNQEKTAFMTDKGIYCYKVMPFALENAGSTYQRLVNMMFKEHIGRTMEVRFRVCETAPSRRKTSDALILILPEASERKTTFFAERELLFAARDHPSRREGDKNSFWIVPLDFQGYFISLTAEDPSFGGMTQRGIEASLDQVKAITELQSPRNVKEVQKLTGHVAALNRFISRSSDKCHLFYNVLRKNQGFLWTNEHERALQDLKQYMVSPPLLTKPVEGESLQLYLAVSNNATSAVLIREEDQQQQPIYYGEIWCTSYDASSRPQTMKQIRSLVAGLDIAHKLGAKHLHVRSDSLLVVNQVNGDFQAKDSKMTTYLKIVKDRVARFDHFSIEQIPRDLNTQADALANLGSAFNDPSMESIPILHLTMPTIEIKEEVQMNEEVYNWSLYNPSM
ncbi:hypothetical protein OSB04_028440 [Centaurea solstitialis]|uniref:RNase H type-1 domain-containing protein n=1 Tax=Centaurea solstitialis TaxID=347529 RepID=A0AA38SFJ6_9ASTR|nr:hypothetical protein OSB04_028440 [Centaurea solstitialis]